MAGLHITPAVSGASLTLPASNGSDDTAALNAALAAAAGDVVRGRPGETYLLSDPLVLYSGTTLDMTGCTVQLLASSSVEIGGNTLADCRMVTNVNCFTGRTVQDGVTTASSTTLTSATAAFTAGDVGETIRVWGAGAYGEPLDTTIAAVGSATSVTLADAASFAVTATPVHIGDRDEDITIRGGRWERPNMTAPQTNPAWMYAHGFLFRHADKVRIFDTDHWTGGNKYMTNFGEGLHCTVERLTAETASDGVHFTGPCAHIIVRDVMGTFHDDAVAFCTGEVAYGNGTGDTQGPIYDVIVDNVSNAGIKAVVKLAGSSYGYVHRDFRCNNLTDLGSGTAIAIAGDTGAPVTDDVRFSNIVGGSYISSGTHQRVTFSSVRFDRSTGNAVEVLNAAAVKELVVNDLSRDPAAADGVTAIYVHDSGSTVDALHVNGGRWATKGNVVLAGISGTIGQVFCTGTEHSPSNTSSAGCLVVAATTAAITAIHAAACRGLGAFGFEVIAGTTTLTIAGGIYNQTLHAGATGIVTVFGEWEQVATGNQRDSGGIIRSRAPGWRCHVNDLSADQAGLVALNRNSSLSCGLGPVATVAANKWQHTVTGAVYAPAGSSTVAAGAGAGTGASASLSGTDGGGTITVTTGTGTAAGAVATHTSIQSWGATPKSIVITPTNAAAQAAGLYVSAKSATAFTVSAAIAPAASGSLTFDFVVQL